MLISLKSRKIEEAPLFHSVDKLWNKNGHICQCIPAHEDKAWVTILELIPLLHHKFRDNIVKSFTPDSVEMMQNASYDAESGEVLFPMDA